MKRFFEVRYADSFRCVDAETADAARAIAAAMDRGHPSTVVEVVEITHDEDSLFLSDVQRGAGRMNDQAQTIMLGMRAMAKGAANSHDTSEIVWRGIACRYYPLSSTYGWFHGDTDITRGLTRDQVISLINIELEDHEADDGGMAEERERHP